MTVPRFQQDEIDLHLYKNAGDAFQQFAADILRQRHPNIHPFLTAGNDGGIDLSITEGDERTVFECKFVGSDDENDIIGSWEKTASTLSRNLKSPDGPPLGQAQYSPWYEQNPAIIKYVFCTNAIFCNQRRHDDFRNRIQVFFKKIADDFQRTKIEVEIMDWSNFSTLLEDHPHILFKWFKKDLIRGLTLLDEKKTSSETEIEDITFRSYLDAKHLPHYSLAHHLSRSPVPRPDLIKNETELFELLRAGKMDGV